MEKKKLMVVCGKRLSGIEMEKKLMVVCGKVRLG
jgi:hypothetical protein